MRAELKEGARRRRHLRVRKKVSGTTDRPRLAVYRSNRHIYAQLIDDRAGRTLVAATDKGMTGHKTDVAKEVGKALADRARSTGIDRAVFDRGGRLYHGRVKALAEGAREGGLHI
ncbi:MAG TPA: 50S ribosomal protein L18 [Actinomycetota bacterium]